MLTPSLAESDVTEDLETALSTSLNPMLALARRTTRAVGDNHVGATTFDKEYLVSRCKCPCVVVMKYGSALGFLVATVHPTENLTNQCGKFGDLA